MDIEEHAKNPRPVFLESSKTNAAGCVLLHGFVSSPSELYELGQYLHQQGLHVSIPLLPGHGKTVEDLNLYRQQDWLAHAQQALGEMCLRTQKVFLIGTSMGSALSLSLAKEHSDLAGLVLMSTPLWIKSRAIHTLFTFLDKTHLWNLLPPRGLANKPKRKPQTRRFVYNRFPKYPTRALVRLINQTNRDLSQIHQPTIFLHSKSDPLTRYPHLLQLVRGLPQMPTIETFEDMHHCMTCDKNRHAVFEKVLVFINKHRGESQ